MWLAVSVTGVPAAEDDDILFQKKELEQIQKEVETSQRRLDSLKQEELRVQKRIAEYDQRIAGNRKVVKRLARELKQLKKNIAQAQAQLEANQEHLERVRRRFLGDLRQFYFSTRRPEPMLTGSPNTEVELTRRIIYLRALADLESDFVAQAETYLAQSQQQLSRLTGERKKVYRLKKKKETATALEKSKKTQQQKALERLRRKKLEEADRILTLQQAAEEMARIIGRLEQERKRRLLEEQAQPGVPSAFAALKGQLASPCRGKIVVGFGYSVDPVTKLKSFSPGITIKGKAGRPVTAVADGTVAYGGRLRGYGNFVIINHDGQFYTTYGGLDRILVETNEYVLAGTKLGTAGADGLVKFELRRGREPLDPVKWIRIDVF
jgi:septal ring factor EnvC (AmiA/AmiB activator)